MLLCGDSDSLLSILLQRFTISSQISAIVDLHEDSELVDQQITANSITLL